VHVEKDGEQEYAEGAVMMDNMRGCGLDFVVDCGMRVCSLCSRLLHTCIAHTSKSTLTPAILGAKFLVSSGLLAPIVRNSIIPKVLVITPWRMGGSLMRLHAVQVSEGSTIIDLTSKDPILVRDGKGDASVFVQELAVA